MYKYLIIAIFVTSLLSTEIIEKESNDLHKLDIKPKYTFFEPDFDKKKVLWSLVGITTSVITTTLLYKYDDNIRDFFYNLFGCPLVCKTVGYPKPFIFVLAKTIKYGRMPDNGHCTDFQTLINTLYNIMAVSGIGFLGYKTYMNVEKFNEGRRPQYSDALKKINKAKEIHNMRRIANQTIAVIDELQKTIKPIDKTDYITLNEID